MKLIAIFRIFRWRSLAKRLSWCLTPDPLKLSFAYVLPKGEPVVLKKQVALPITLGETKVQTSLFISPIPLPDRCDFLVGQDLVHLMKLRYIPEKNQVVSLKYPIALMAINDSVKYKRNHAFRIIAKNNEENGTSHRSQVKDRLNLEHINQNQKKNTGHDTCFSLCVCLVVE